MTKESKTGVSLSGRLLGKDAGVVALGLMCVAVVGVAFNALATQPGLLVGWLAVACSLVGLGFVGRHILKKAGAVSAADVSPTKIVFTSGGIRASVSAPLANAEEVVKVLRIIMQGRGELTPPHGEVTGGDPTNETALRAYTAEEQQRRAVQMRQEVEENDRQAVARLREALGPAIAPPVGPPKVLGPGELETETVLRSDIGSPTQEGTMPEERPVDAHNKAGGPE